MTICNESDDDLLGPAQQSPHGNQVGGRQDEGLAARAKSLPESVLGGSDVKLREGEDNPGEGYDMGRFTAGIVRFYDAILKEPIPEKMLRLIGEIAKRERKP